MNAYSKAFSGVIAAFQIEEPFAIRHRLLQVMELCGNADSADRHFAIEAIAERRPAFWTSAQYGDQRAKSLAVSANMGMTVLDAMAKHYPPFAWRHRQSGLDCLIPLTTAAAHQIADAYVETGTFRSIEELERRRERAPVAA